MSTRFSFHNLAHPVFNGAGTCKSLPEVRDFAKSAVSAVMTGTFTKEPRAGNSGMGLYMNEAFTLNSMALPNQGMAALKEELPEMVEVCRQRKKPLIVSVGGHSKREIVELVRLAVRSGADAVEWNASCANLKGRDRPDRLIANCPARLGEVLNSLAQVRLDGAALGVKLGPYTDAALRRDIAVVLNLHQDTVSFVTASNSLGDAFWPVQYEKGLLGGDGYGSFAGASYFPIAIGQFQRLRDELDDQIECVGVGGICTAIEASAYLRAGAAAVQVVSAFLIDREEYNTPKAFGRFRTIADSLGW